ncbi:endonuclease V [Candidatus Woesearchaeota archaeon]|nr:endonuclease V [Candidatus Woesearchaeota archaeon]
MNLEKLRNEQDKLAEKLLLVDNIECSSLIGAIATMYSGEMIITAIVIYDAAKKVVIERVSASQEAAFKHSPEFICFREGPTVMMAYEKVTKKPDFFFIEGTGILHPRKMGTASYIGLLTDTPTIGVSSKQLFGQKTGDTVVVHKEVVAKIIPTKEKAKPLYVSQGNKISLKTAVELTKQYLQGHKLPEPLYIAYKYAVKIKHIRSTQ